MKQSVLSLAMAWCLVGCQQAKPPVSNGAVTATGFQFAYRFREIPPVDLDNEIRFYREKLKLVPADAAVQVALAQAYLSKAQSSGDVSYFGEAEKLARSALKLKPRNPKGAHMVLASLAEARHDFADSFTIARSIHEQDAGDFDARAMMSNSLMELGRLPEALVLSTALVQDMPGTASALQAARVLIASGRDAQARPLIEAAIRQEQPQENKASARLRSLLGETELRHGNLEEAEKLLQASLEASPENPQTWEILARLKLRQGQGAEAEKLYLAAFAKTQHPLLLREVAMIKLARGEEAESGVILEQAETLLKPEVARGSYGHARDLARVYLDLKRPREALKLLQQEEKQRQDWRLYELKAIALDRCKDRDGALQALKKALASGIQEPSLYQRAVLWEPAAGWQEKLKAIDSSYTPSLLEP
ncbi:tetratricopeptide repeat protein [bacterium]|nr:tetratricopeptide repeat protein [bacterium]